MKLIEDIDILIDQLLHSFRHDFPHEKINSLEDVERIVLNAA